MSVAMVSFVRVFLGLALALIPHLELIECMHFQQHTVFLVPSLAFADAIVCSHSVFETFGASRSHSLGPAIVAQCFARLAA